MKANTMTVSTVYTFAMPKFVYVQVTGVEKPAKIEADKVERENVTSATAGDYKLTISRDGKPVGEFRGSKVDGWWIQDET